MKGTPGVYSINAATRPTGVLRVRQAATVIGVRRRPDAEEAQYQAGHVFVPAFALALSFLVALLFCFVLSLSCLALVSV